MNYDVNYFLNKFSAIPESLWSIGRRHDGHKHCAHGWCNLDEGDEYNGLSEEEKGLISVVECLTGEGCGIALINNGTDSRYNQITPKQRVLAALYDIKKLQEGKQEPKPSYPDITKQLAILPIEETTDKVQSHCPVDTVGL